MKQTLTRDAFIHNLQGERSDKNSHNIMILGHAVFDLHDAVKELLERTKWLDKGKPEIKMASTHEALKEGLSLKALKIAPLTPEEEAMATKEQELIDKKTGVSDASLSKDEGVESF